MIHMRKMYIRYAIYRINGHLNGHGKQQLTNEAFVEQKCLKQLNRGFRLSEGTIDSFYREKYKQ